MDALEVRPLEGPSGAGRPASHRQTSRARKVAIGGVALVVAGLVLWAVSEVGGSGPGLKLAGVAIEGVSGLIVLFAYSLSILGLTAIGYVIASRVPRNRIGWILIAVGLWVASPSSWESYSQPWQVRTLVGATSPT